MGFISILKHIGQDIDKVFHSTAFQDSEKVASAMISMAVPGFGSAFNLTANAVMQAEANFAAVGKSKGTGEQKLAAVLTGSGNLITAALSANKGSAVTQKEVAEYIGAVVSVLNNVPSSIPDSPQPPGREAPMQMILAGQPN